MDRHDQYNYTSLMATKDAALRSRLECRSKVLHAVRQCFIERGYLEIDTPILRRYEDPTDNPVFSTLGAFGWPRLHLRTCPEEYTRRAAAAFGKAFEIGKNFRNASIDPDKVPRRHLVEFTIVEFYERGENLEAALTLLWEILKGVADKLNISHINFDGKRVDMTGTYARVKVLDALENTNEDECTEFARKHRNVHAQTNRDDEAGTLEKLIDNYIRPKLVEPTFLSDFPRSADPYPDPHVGNCLQRAELSIAGMEVGEVAVLQTDVQALHDHLQNSIRDRHGECALSQLIDRAYLDEIERLDTKVIGGGFGFDRLLMLLTGEPDIREVVWYPGISEYFTRRRPV